MASLESPIFFFFLYMTNCHILAFLFGLYVQKGLSRIVINAHSVSDSPKGGVATHGFSEVASSLNENSLLFICECDIKGEFSYQLHILQLCNHTPLKDIGYIRF